MIGSSRGVQHVAEVAVGLPGVEILALPYGAEEDAPRLALEAADTVDALLFCGPVPYELAAPVLPAQVATAHIPYDGAGLVKALFDLYREHGAGTRFSIDCIPPEDALLVVGEVGGDFGTVHAVYDGREPMPRGEIVERHLALAKEGKTTAAVTYLHSVHRELEAAGLPSVYVEPLTSTIRVALRHATLLGVSRSYEGSQVAVAMVQLAIGGEIDATRRERVDLSMRSLLLDLAAQLDAVSLPVEPGLYTLFTTKDGLERSPGWATRGLSGLDRLTAVSGIDAKAGIGFGRTSRDAQANARRALELAGATDGVCTYVVLRDRAVLGPLRADADAALRPTRILDSSVQERARAAGVSASSLTNVYLTLTGAGVFDNERLATLLGVTPRSARRIASRLVAHGIAEPAGEEQFHQRGRPRQLYRLRPVVSPPPHEQVGGRPLAERSDPA